MLSHAPISGIEPAGLGRGFPIMQNEGTLHTMELIPNPFSIEAIPAPMQGEESERL